MTDMYSIIHYIMFTTVIIIILYNILGGESRVYGDGDCTRIIYIFIH